MDQDTLSRIWGKAGTDSHHPALLHMLDVAAVAHEIFPLLPGQTRENLLNPLPESGRLKLEQLCLLVACHDLGKVSPGFQEKVDRLAVPLRELGLEFPRKSETQHGRVTWAKLPPYLINLGCPEESAERVAHTVGGHHGKFSPVATQRLIRCGKGIWDQLRDQTFLQLRQALGVEELSLPERLPTSWLLLLAGFTTVADWIGSSHFFEFAPEARGDAAYFEARRQLAHETLHQVGWRKWRPPAEPPGFSTLFDHLTPTGTEFRPRGIQETVERILPELTASSLVLIEASTGSGKTEASLQAAMQLCSRAYLGGIYYALPTQATSNQMFGRVREFLENLGEQGLELHLVHGLRDLEEEYLDLSFQDISDLEGRTIGAVQASEWFRARKRGVLSPFAVGTIDQALLAAEQTKHFFVRLFGLAGKVVVLDEIHAYDTFTGRILDRMLQWLREVGASVILLSATLPLHRRQELLECWGADGLELDSSVYPRVTVASPGAPPRVHPGPSVSSRRVALEETSRELEAVAERLLEEISEGGCAAWIVNRVPRAQAAFRALERQGARRGIDLEILHSRLRVADRVGRANQIVSRFSRSGDRPDRFVVVSTQILEQSLDVDFDLMVSDLAPVDLILQRVGRLHRHPREHRPERLRAPRLLWSPLPPCDDSRTLCGESLPYAGHVMLRSQWALRRREGLYLPAENDLLLEEVYGERPPPEELEPIWSESETTMLQKIEGAGARAGRTLIPAPPPPRKRAKSFFSRLVHELDDSPGKGRGALQAKTRDIDASVTLVCLYGTREAAFLDPEHREPIPLRRPNLREQRKLIECSLTISGMRWVRKIEGTFPVHPAWSSVANLREARLALLDDAGKPVLANNEAPWLQLDPDLGLVLRSDPGKEVETCP